MLRCCERCEDFAFVFAVCSFLGKGLDRHAPAQLQLLRQVNRREIPFPNLLLRFELLVKPPLVELPPQNLPADL